MEQYTKMMGNNMTDIRMRHTGEIVLYIIM